MRLSTSEKRGYLLNVCKRFHLFNNSLVFYTATVLAFGVSFIGCFGHNRYTGVEYQGGIANSVFVSNGDVYVAGSQLYQYWQNGFGSTPRQPDATLWKNGVIQSQLVRNRSTSEANAVFVTGADVYVSGIEQIRTDTGGDYVLLYKNALLQHINIPYGITPQVTSITVSGGDVYITGMEISSKYENGNWKYYAAAVLWKNGTAQYLSDASYSAANSVCVSGDDVYVAGSELGRAVLWKNGVAQYLNDSGTAKSVFIANGDVYVAGIVKVSDDKNEAALWKNGAVQYMTDTSRGATANSVYVSGNDVYIAGLVKISDDGIGKHEAVLWKNNVMQNLTNSASYFTTANSVFVSGGDVYVAGSENDFPRLWKNGVEQVMQRRTK